MIVPAEIGHPVRICALRQVWEHLPSIDGLDSEQLLELHAHHLAITNDGPAMSCVVVHHLDGPIAGATISLAEWFGLPTPSDLLEIPDTLSALLDPEWEPSVNEPGLNALGTVVFDGCVKELLHLIQRWETGRPITRTVNLLRGITEGAISMELMMVANQALEVVARVSRRRSPRRADRVDVIELLQRVVVLYSDREDEDD